MTIIRKQRVKPLKVHSRSALIQCVKLDGKCTLPIKWRQNLNPTMFVGIIQRRRRARLSQKRYAWLT